MSQPTGAVAIEELLEHAGWIRALARRLTSDSSAAEDLEQATWVAALEHPPAGDRPLREWLGAVLRNFARQSRRGDLRRGERERRVAHAEALPSTAELMERASLQRELVGAVMELDEPYRTAILLRFFEGLPPRAIARRLGVPVETVRTRVARGIDKLRARLDRSFGGREAWVLALWPIADRPLAIPTSVVGTLVMNAKVKVALTVVSLVGVLGVWYALRAEPAPVENVVAAAPKSELSHPASEPQTEEIAIAPDVARAEAPLAKSAPAAAVASTPAPEVAAALPLRGRVLDSSGAAASGITVQFRDSDDPKLDETKRTTSRADGTFEMKHPGHSGRLVAADPRLATVLAGMVGMGAGKLEPVVVVAGRIALAGIVVDEAGAPLEGARVDVALPEDFRTRFRAVLDLSTELHWTIESDEDGRFDLPQIPAVSGAKLRVARDGYEPWQEPLPGVDDTNMNVVLTRPKGAEGLVRGKVVDLAGQPVEGARVAHGVDTTLTEASGEFAFKLKDPESFNQRFGMAANTLTAAKRGFLPAMLEARIENGEPSWPAFVTLRLGSETLSVSGRVLGTDGERLASARVWIADATFFGAVDGEPTQLENLLAGAEGEFWHYATTDDDGEFRIDGLVDREYTLRAMDPATLLRVDKSPVRAGASGVELEMPQDALYPRVAGKVSSHSGKGVANVRIFPMCDAFQARVKGEIIGTSHDALDGVLTDAEGRFEILNVPKSLVYLRVEGSTILPLEYGRYVEGDKRFVNSIKELPRDHIETLEIVVEQRCHVQIELIDPSSADELAVIGADGREVTINIFVGDGRRENPRAPILEGRSHMLGVPDDSVTIVLFKNGAEVSRTPFEPKPGEQLHLRL